MRDNEYTASLLQDFRSRFIALHRAEMAAHEEMDCCDNPITCMAAAEEGSMEAASFKNTVLEFLGILVSLPGSQRYNLRPRLVRYMADVLNDDWDKVSAAGLLTSALIRAHSYDELEIWGEVSDILDTTTEEQNKLVFPLLQLPLEIRRQIYLHYFDSHLTCDDLIPDDRIRSAETFSLCHSSRIILVGARLGLEPDLRSNRLALLVANRQIHAEASLVLFTNFTLFFDGVKPLQLLVEELSATSKSLIRNLFVCDIFPSHTAVLSRCLSDCHFTNVRRVRLEGEEPEDSWSTFTTDKYLPSYEPKLAQAVEGLLERSDAATGSGIKPSLELYDFAKESMLRYTPPQHWNVSMK